MFEGVFDEYHLRPFRFPQNSVRLFKFHWLIRLSNIFLGTHSFLTTKELFFKKTLKLFFITGILSISAISGLFAQNIISFPRPEDNHLLVDIVKVFQIHFFFFVLTSIKKKKIVSKPFVIYDGKTFMK